MAKLATFIVATFAGGILGVVGVFAAVSAVNPSADHVANVITVDPQKGAAAYGSR